MLRIAGLVAGLLTILTACATGTGPAPAVPRPSSGDADVEMLTRWSTWTMSGIAEPGYDELPHRDHCAQDPQSDVWFLDAATRPGTEERSCTVPAGKRLLVVASGAASADKELCSYVLAETTVELLVDGVKHDLQKVGPAPQLSTAHAGLAQAYVCAHTAILAPLTTGSHRIIASSNLTPPAAVVDFTITVQ